MMFLTQGILILSLVQKVLVLGVFDSKLLILSNFGTSMMSWYKKVAPFRHFRPKLLKIPIYIKRKYQISLFYIKITITKNSTSAALTNTLNIHKLHVTYWFCTKIIQNGSETSNPKNSNK